MKDKIMITFDAEKTWQNLTAVYDENSQQGSYWRNVPQ